MANLDLQIQFNEDAYKFLKHIYLKYLQKKAL